MNSRMTARAGLRLDPAAASGTCPVPSVMATVPTRRTSRREGRMGGMSAGSGGGRNPIVAHQNRARKPQERSLGLVLVRVGGGRGGLRLGGLGGRVAVVRRFRPRLPL